MVIISTDMLYTYTYYSKSNAHHRAEEGCLIFCACVCCLHRALTNMMEGDKGKGVAEAAKDLFERWAVTFRFLLYYV